MGELAKLIELEVRSEAWLLGNLEVVLLKRERMWLQDLLDFIMSFCIIVGGRPMSVCRGV